MIHYPGFNPIAFQVGPVKVHWYGIMYLVGFVAAWWLGRRRASRPGSTWKAQDVDDVIFFAMLGVILGGRIGYVLFYGLGYWAQDPFYPLKITQGGMSFHGGLTGVLIAVAIFAWRRKRHVADVFDALTSDRPYHDGRSAELAFEILQKGIGAEFDRSCVEALLRARQSGKVKTQRERANA